MPQTRADSLVVLDFETTGLSPDMGDRAIEIGAVRLEKGEVVERFQALMNPGKRISAFIEDYTGITNQMLSQAAPCDEVTDEFASFMGDSNLVAHNASFDKRFLDAELRRVSRAYTGAFACSLLVARRLYQQAPNHKLGSLIAYKNIPSDGGFHRALFDSEMTAKLWMTMLQDISQITTREDVPFSLIQKLAKTPKIAVYKLLQSGLPKI
ncbi:3'-5' exonuclease [Aliiglaciecola sp. LCG003]|uniref:3'-5' exonuclease n=1 Tax=Aliiglaciecola sp. LCG003 TaxID=3053655 RepID=UPI002573A181|nr:3'-5' exonuclease [Aliiglaciecola sp. LCG003]WJG08073.1 3'-5' exonuclease [Aliiglaciecola sp. LCG003]